MDESLTKCQELILKIFGLIGENFSRRKNFYINDRFVNDICTDFMTETDPASPCSFVDEKRSGQRICTARDFERKDCSKHANIKVNL